MSRPEQWDEAGFREAVRSGTVLADFYSEWCGPCKLQAKTLEEMADEIPGTVRVGQVDVEAAPAIAAEYGVSSIPTLILFKDGAVAETRVGLCGREPLLAMLKKHL